MSTELTPELIRTLFDYRADGRLIRLCSGPGGRAKAGTPAFSVTPGGYGVFNYKGKQYRHARAVYAWHHGKWPEFYIDHINGNRSDDRIENLRDVTAEINSQNRFVRASKNSTGFPGVVAVRQRFVANIRFKGGMVHLGTFDTPAEALASYVTAKKLLHNGYISDEQVQEKIEAGQLCMELGKPIETFYGEVSDG